MSSPMVGVLALQGDVREHVHTLTQVGARVRTVRRPEELEQCDALVLPGGESSTIWRLATTFGMVEPIRAALGQGMPAFGTCAGMVLLADEVLDKAPGQEPFGGIDMTVRRNAFGRQVDSFEHDLDVTGLADPVRAVFIRAPAVERVGPSVEVLATSAGKIVAVRSGRLLATSFHPEVGGDTRIHELFLAEVAGR